jgi:hypothetical protein
MKREGRSLIVRKEPDTRVVLRMFPRLTLCQNSSALSRFEAAETYRRAAAINRRRQALCVDRLA